MNATTLRSAAFLFVAAFVPLFALTLPFPYHVLPDVGGLLRPVTEPCVAWICSALLHLDRPYTAAIVSDSTGMYVHAFLLLIISAAVGIFWSVARRGAAVPSGTKNLFRTAAGYYLALQLLEYGADKLFKHQFGVPEPNILYASVGSLTRDILYWSTVGSSYSYNVVAGAVEGATALLLLFRRTRLLGALCAVGVMANIVVINFTFDISVKLYSCFLLFLGLVVAWPALTRLFVLLVLNRPSGAMDPPRPALSGRRTILHAVGKATLIVVILFEALYPYFTAGNFNDDMAARPALHGAWNVEMFVRNGDTVPPATDAAFRPRRFFVHRRGYFITQSMRDEMTDYKLGYRAADSELILNANDGATIALHYTLSGNDSLITLQGTWRSDSVTIRARRLNLDALPLLQPTFHWTIDDYR
ncbi:MAG TPA: hypothetical protein VHI13_21570 [Candidatus Kapabacteria bacterium]|nr:hypothetical protein [Candidatus Kapabacteria bacterium]